MTEMATVVQSMNPGERQALISQAMQMMTPMMQGSVDPQQFQQIEGSAAEMFNVFANSPSQNDGNTK
jgi:ABC-type multidrug transport system fused ATPase/permease subunit